MANDLKEQMRTLAGEAGVGGFPATETILHAGADRIEELEKALENSAKGWAGLLALGFIPERHRPTAVGLREEAFATLSARAYKGE